MSAEADHDRARASTHSYLGSTTELRSSAALRPGEVVDLPYVVQQGCCLLPGQTLPLLLHSSGRADEDQHRQALRCALRDRSKALVACAVSLETTHDPHMAHASPHVCIAEVRSVSCYQHADAESESVPDSVVLKGRYRAQELRRYRSSYRVAARLRARVDPECADGPAPGPFTRSETYWHASVARSFDMHVLEQRARALFKALSPSVQAPLGLRPDHLSYFLINAVGLPANERYALFCVPTAALRLQQLCRVMRQQQREACFVCQHCAQPIGALQSKITMTEIEQDTVFVNPHGTTHGLTCVSAVFVGAVQTYGNPSSEFSWFPSYAWTVLGCGGCGSHLGWRFTRLRKEEEGSGLQQFWGLANGSVFMPSVTQEENVLW